MLENIAIGAEMFKAIIQDRPKNKVEKMVDGYFGFLYTDDNGMPLVAIHWEHRFNNMVGRYNEIYKVQIPNITPHVCRHTYCTNMAKSGMNPKTLQYLMESDHEKATTSRICILLRMLYADYVYLSAYNVILYMQIMEVSYAYF